MPIEKDGNGVIQYTPMAEAPRALETGTFIDEDFAICDEKDQLKQIRFDTADQTTDTNVIFKTKAGNVGDVVLTLPNVDTELGEGGGGGAAFTIVQCDAGTNPVATGETDTLTLTSSDSSLTVTGDSSTDEVDFAVRYSNPPSGTTESEQFGASSSVTGNHGTAYGQASLAGDGDENTAVGHNASAGSAGNSARKWNVAIGSLSNARGAVTGYCTLVGRNTLSTIDYSTGIGGSVTCNAQGGFAAGYGSKCNNGALGGVSLGGNSDDSASGQLVVGSSIYPITEGIFGEGPTSSTPQDFTFRVTNGSGTNIAAGNMYIRVGASTGNADPGEMIFQTTEAGASGTTLQTYTTVLRLDSGNVFLDNVPTSDPGLTGAIWSDSGTLKVS